MSQSPSSDTPKHGFAALEEARQRSLQAARRASQQKGNASAGNAKDMNEASRKGGQSPGSKHH
jgi:hypothetical protein